MSEMIERGAKAIFLSEGYPEKNWLTMKEGYREKYRAMARAAIEAMREPTEEMVKAVYDQEDPGFCDERGDPTSPDDAWRQMIDAILTSSTASPSQSPVPNTLCP